MSEGIDLDFGGADAVTAYVPVPAGIYTLVIDEANVEATKAQDGNFNIVTISKVADGPLSGRSTGKDWRYVPNRNTQTPDKYVQTAGFFKGWLQAILNKEIPDTFKLNVRELPGKKFKAVVILEDNGYGPQNSIKQVFPVDTDTAGIVLPAVTPRKESNGGGAGQEAAAGRFTI